MASTSGGREKGKQPDFIGPADGNGDTVLALGGLWETWVSPDGGEIENLTLIHHRSQRTDGGTPQPHAADSGAGGFWRVVGRWPRGFAAALQGIHHLLRPYAADKMRVIGQHLRQ